MPKTQETDINEKGDTELLTSLYRPWPVWEQWLRCVKCHTGGSHWVLTWGGSGWSSWRNTSAHTNILSRASSALSLQMFAFLETSLCPADGKSSQEKAAGDGFISQCHTAAQWAPAAADMEHHQDRQRRGKRRLHCRRCDGCGVPPPLRTDIVLWKTVHDLTQSWEMCAAGLGLWRVSMERLRLGSKGFYVCI